MAAIVIRNLPDDVHATLKKLAAERKQPLEALARDTLSDLARQKRGGIDFEKLARNRAALGLFEDGPVWTPDFDDPKLSRQVLGLEKPRKRAKRKR